MKIRIEFDCDNAAFDEVPLVEAQRIIRQAERKLALLDPFGDSIGLFDSNGNRIGNLKILD